MSRQKKLDKMDVIELAAEKPKPEFNFKEARTPGRYIFETKQLVIGYDEPLSSPAESADGTRREDRPDRSQRNWKDDVC